MESPEILQGVKVRGRQEVFLVSQVYRSLGVVDLVPLGCAYIVETGVPFENLEFASDEDLHVQQSAITPTAP